MDPWLGADVPTAVAGRSCFLLVFMGARGWVVPTIVVEAPLDPEDPGLGLSIGLEQTPRFIWTVRGGWGRVTRVGDLGVLGKLKGPSGVSHAGFLASPCLQMAPSGVGAHP